ncbi:MAG: DNA-processing protein DprA [Candidatus Pacebacteria bacterium]|nr:DNA-processing protein DprA [Candidatus Paceibacterota bacterium]MBP9832587.1 DNA-processing protein DprA [Candidatus Paceibacterota bacterium]
MVEIKKLKPQNFPALLSEINDPPETLYLRGVLPPPETKLLAVVGSRRMSRYGQDACEYLIQGLAGYPISIVSGLALGIDGVAHRAALTAGLHTIAVPGSGLSEEALYPRAHLTLSRNILDSGGALLSEMEPDEPAAPYTFPKRNRIMAGMSHATLIIEAGLKSGTLITARLATEYNRELLIVPHSIFSEGGTGGHLFMGLGARPVRSADDILDVFDMKKEETKKNIELTPDEERVIGILSAPMPRDELIRALGVATGSANVLLTQMEIRGIIIEFMGEIRKNI